MGQETQNAPVVREKISREERGMLMSQAAMQAAAGATAAEDVVTNYAAALKKFAELFEVVG